MSRKERSILIRVTDKEREIIKRKAAKLGMTVSEYVRTALIHTDNLNITMIDVRPIEKIATELHKQGVNLNQLMKFLTPVPRPPLHVRFLQTIPAPGSIS